VSLAILRESSLTLAMSSQAGAFDGRRPQLVLALHRPALGDHRWVGHRMAGQRKGFGKAMPFVLAAGAAAAILRFRLHEEPLLADKRLKHRLLSVPPPPKMDTGPFDWEAIRATCDATMRVDTQDGSRYLETWVPERVLMQDAGVRRGGTPGRGLAIPQNNRRFPVAGTTTAMDIGPHDTLWMRRLRTLAMQHSAWLRSRAPLVRAWTRARPVCGWMNAFG
jgi:hypothetical protein